MIERKCPLIIGGTARTAEMINYCCSHGIYPDVKLIAAEEVSDALKQLDKKNDAATRFVIDCATIPRASTATA